MFQHFEAHGTLERVRRKWEWLREVVFARIDSHSPRGSDAAGADIDRLKVPDLLHEPRLIIRRISAANIEDRIVRMERAFKMKIDLRLGKGMRGSPARRTIPIGIVEGRNLAGICFFKTLLVQDITIGTFDIRSVTLPSKTLGRLSRARSERSCKIVIAEDSFDLLGERIGIGGWDDDPIGTVFDKFSRSGVFRSNDG